MPETDNPKHDPPWMGHGELILVVDDEPAVAELVRRILEISGFKVAMAADGLQALAYLQSHSSEVKAVLTDIRMPKMDGSELLQEIRKMAPSMPVLGITALMSRADMVELQSHPFTGLVQKPFTVPGLRDALAKALAPAKDN